MKAATNMVWNATMLVFALFFACIVGVGMYDGFKTNESLLLIVQHNAQALLALCLIVLLYIPQTWRRWVTIGILTACIAYFLSSPQTRGQALNVMSEPAAMLGFGAFLILMVINFYIQRGHKRKKA